MKPVPYRGPCTYCGRNLYTLAWPLILGPACGSCRAAHDPAWSTGGTPPRPVGQAPELDGQETLFDVD